MSTTIYYFSATGNSLTTAKILANQLGDCYVVSVPSTRQKLKLVEESDSVGFVFPVYYSDMPYPVRELISKMIFKKETYIFIFTTFKGHTGNVAKRMDQLLKSRGQKLSLSLGIPMPGNSFISDTALDQEHLAQQKENIEKVVEAIKNREIQDYAETDVIPHSPVSYPNNFRGIMAEDNCVSCGICVQICPMNNIKIQDKKAVIGDSCVTCLACFHWCPVEAIYMSKQENIARRKKYRHPDVTLKDIINGL